MFSARYFKSRNPFILISGLCLFCGINLLSLATAHAQNVASIQSFSMRPFVTGITPVIGSNGAVGGVLVDAAGVVSRIDQGQEKQLRQKWRQAQLNVDKDATVETAMRVISLARLDRALGRLIDDGKPLTPEIIFLAGMRRVQYVFVVPEQNDVLLAGPAGAWRANEAGEVVSVKNGLPLLRLDDLFDALRGGGGKDGGITCSIEPTAEGLRRYARLRARLRTFSKQAVQSMQQALGPQQVIVNGIAPDSHFARVMVSADYVMKRLAMGFDAAPIADMPNYLQLLQRRSTGVEISSPRWWMTVNYEPLRCTPDRLAWQIRGQGVKTMTEDSVLTDEGEREVPAAANRLAQQWADTMTENYDALSAALPIFGELRNCIDLTVVGALIASEGLLVQADCDLPNLTDAGRLQGPRLPVAKSIPSQASLVKGRGGWIISVSGGVEIDAWSIVGNVQTDESLTATKAKAIQAHQDRWWW